MHSFRIGVIPCRTDIFIPVKEKYATFQYNTFHEGIELSGRVFENEALKRPGLTTGNSSNTVLLIDAWAILRKIL